ncbi:hypothetical protein KL936_004896 [Ogataea polymorpha]|uniref:Something about silencing protein 4 domain-containing protein n=2 Tax=Ogataea polymorpha TaxID=460523 RepID=A0A9P8T0Z6_9ASCO|nr:hypothetical protein KL936_004896 [Ogataea polymorpha]KAH3661146.1 hypothetical protein OGATHE_005479 [Ogataea polymorpha]
MGDETNRRPLRGGEDKHKSTDLYNFDSYLATGVPEQLSMNVVSKVPAGARLRHNPELDDFRDAVERYPLNLVDLRTKAERRQYSLPPTKQVNRNKDPLDSKLFEAFHKRGEKEEKRFARDDRNKLLREYQNCMELLGKLGGSKAEQKSDRLRFLLETTKINNVNDPMELDIKFMLTVKELIHFVLNYERVKQLEAEIKSTLDKDRWDEPDGNLEEIRAHRKRRMIRNHGPTVKIKFLDGIVLQFDPLGRAKIQRR